MNLREQAEAKVLSLKFEHYAPKHALDPRNLVDRDGLHPALNALPVVGNMADAVSTDRKLGQGAREANPVMKGVIDKGGMGAFYAVKLGLGIGMALAADAFARKGHTRIAKTLAVLSGAVPLAAAVHNSRQ